MTVSSLFHIRSRVRGFTLVETLTATFVISMVVLGPLTVAIHASSYARETKNLMTATYLAQEALELLHQQQDSIYLRCVSADNVNCPLTDPDGNGTYELPKEAAWRIFRSRLSAGVDCFAASGCSYDVIDMTTNQDANPTKYLPTSTSCKYLSITSANLYVCSGVSAHITGTPVQTTFSRKVQISALDTFVEGSTKYNDDFRVTVTVSFVRANGYVRQIQVVDFLHARS